MVVSFGLFAIAELVITLEAHIYLESRSSPDSGEISISKTHNGTMSFTIRLESCPRPELWFFSLRLCIFQTKLNVT